MVGQSGGANISTHKYKHAQTDDRWVMLHCTNVHLRSLFSISWS